MSFTAEIRKVSPGNHSGSGVCEAVAVEQEALNKDERKSATYEEALAHAPANKEHNDVANSALSHDEQTSQSKEKAAADNAEQRRRVHTVYEKYFISFMRIRYAWCIFSLLIC